MREVRLVVMLAVFALGASGCTTSIYIEDASRPNSTLGTSQELMPTPVAISTGEPSFCLVSILAEGFNTHRDDYYDARLVANRVMANGESGPRGIYDAVKSTEPFRDFRVLGIDAPDPRGCDLFVKFGVDSEPDPSGHRIERIHVYSAYTKALLWGAWASGYSPILDLARQMHASFQPGMPAYAKHLVEKRIHAPLEGTDVLAWAGPEMRRLSDYGVAYVPPPPEPEEKADAPAASSSDDAWWAK